MYNNELYFIQWIEMVPTAVDRLLLVSLVLNQFGNYTERCVKDKINIGKVIKERWRT